MDNYDQLNEILVYLFDHALDIGITQGFFQEGGTAKESFIPLFDYEGL